MREVNIMTTEITTSDAESIPSPNTARLPAIIPTTILTVESIKLPIVLIHEVRMRILLRETEFESMAVEVISII